MIDRRDAALTISTRSGDPGSAQLGPDTSRQRADFRLATSAAIPTNNRHRSGKEEERAQHLGAQRKRRRRARRSARTRGNIRRFPKGGFGGKIGPRKSRGRHVDMMERRRRTETPGRGVERGSSRPQRAGFCARSGRPTRHTKPKDTQAQDKNRRQRSRYIYLFSVLKLPDQKRNRPESKANIQSPDRRVRENSQEQAGRPHADNESTSGRMYSPRPCRPG